MLSRSRKGFLFTSEVLFVLLITLASMLVFSNSKHVDLNEELLRQEAIDALVVCGKADDWNECVEFVQENIGNYRIVFRECSGVSAEVNHRKACLYHE